MSFDDAVSALMDAEGSDAGETPAPSPAVPEQAPAPSTTPEGGTPAPQVQPEPGRDFFRDEQGRFATPATPEVPAPTADTFDDGKFNPDLLPPELQPGWRQLQAAFTQKTQTLAEQSKQFEGMDPAVAREAVELYTALQDPNYLVQFHGELTTALQAQGLTPAQASAEAARQVEEATGQTGAVTDHLAALRNDPELAPVAEIVSRLEQQVTAMEAERVAERESQEVAQMQMALAGELVRQESVLLQQGATEQDMDRIYALSPNFGGNLLEAAESYRQMRQDLISDYLNGKTAAAPSVAPLPGAGGTSEVPTAIDNMDDALKAALGHLDAQGIDTFDL